MVNTVDLNSLCYLDGGHDEKKNQNRLKDLFPIGVRKL